MKTPIPIDRIEAICAMPGVCETAQKWLRVPGRCYEDLRARPNWLVFAMGLPGADVEKLRAVILARGADIDTVADPPEVPSPPVRVRP